MMLTFLESLDKEASSFLENCSWDTPKLFSNQKTKPLAHSALACGPT